MLHDECACLDATWLPGHEWRCRLCFGKVCLKRQNLMYSPRLTTSKNPLYVWNTKHARFGQCNHKQAHPVGSLWVLLSQVLLLHKTTGGIERMHFWVVVCKWGKQYWAQHCFNVSTFKDIRTFGISRTLKPRTGQKRVKFQACPDSRKTNRLWHSVGTYGMQYTCAKHTCILALCA